MVKKAAQVIVLTTCLIISFFLPLSSWGGGNNSSFLSQFTQELVNLNTLAATHPLSEKHLNEHTVKLVQMRQKQLIQGLEEDPSCCIKYVLTAKQLSSLPQQLQPYLEHDVADIEGILEVQAALYLKSHTERLHYVLRTKGGLRYSINFYDVPRYALKTGQKIRVLKAMQLITSGGVRHLFLSSHHLSIVRDLKENAIQASLGEQKTIVFLVNFQDNPDNQPWTVDAVKDTVFNTINTMLYESSYQQTTVVGTIAGWYTASVPSTSDCGTASESIVATAQDQATKSGIDLSSYTHFVYVFPYISSCRWSGLGTVGSNPTSTTWINGYNTAGVIGHELGHNLGLYHSKFLKCDSGPNTGNCTQLEYGDYSDIMGGGGTAHFNAFQKERLGWLNNKNAPLIQTINLSGTYTLDAYETANNNVKAFKIAKSASSGDYYYLEFRQPIGFDSRLDCWGCDYINGVLIHQANAYTADSSLVLKMNPSSFNQNVMTLLPGNRFEDPNTPNSGVVIAVNSVSPAGANLTITFGSLPPPPPTCIRGTPTWLINPATTQWIPAGGKAGYGLALKNNDSAACDSSTYTFSVQLPAGITSTMGNASLTLAPGRQATTTIQLITTTAAIPGIYAVPITATNTNAAGNTGSINANIGIQAVCTPTNPSVRLNPTSQSAKRGQLLSYQFTVTNNDNSICPASTYTLGSIIPGKFVSKMSSTSITLSPGASSSGTIALTSNNKATQGSYNFTVTAVNSAKTSLSNSVVGVYTVIK